MHAICMTVWSLLDEHLPNSHRGLTGIEIVLFLLCLSQAVARHADGCTCALTSGWIKEHTVVACVVVAFLDSASTSTSVSTFSLTQQRVPQQNVALFSPRRKQGQLHPLLSSQNTPVFGSVKHFIVWHDNEWFTFRNNLGIDANPPPPTDTSGVRSS